MRLVSREMEPGDVEECLRLFCCRRGWAQKYEDFQWRHRQVEVWRKLLRREAVRGGVVKNLDGQLGRRILICGIFAFVHPEWLREYLSAPFPFVGDWVTDQYAQGNDGIILTDNEIRDANSGRGVHSLGLVNGWCPEEQPLLFSLKHSAVEAFKEVMAGFVHNEFVSETIGEIELEFALANRTWRERHRFDNDGGDEWTTRNQPILIGLTRNEAEEPGNDISPLSTLFVRPELRFYFTPSQQKLLRLALIHVSDAQLSQATGINMDALGRRFDRIYKLIERCQDPNNPVFPPGTNSFGKRRLLLNHLDKNIAELRPHKLRRGSNNKAASG